MSGARQNDQHRNLHPAARVARRWRLLARCAEGAGELLQLAAFLLAGAILYAMFTQTHGQPPTGLLAALVAVALVGLVSTFTAPLLSAKATRAKRATAPTALR
jgi:hypothetical protein